MHVVVMRSITLGRCTKTFDFLAMPLMGGNQHPPMVRGCGVAKLFSFSYIDGVIAVVTCLTLSYLSS